MTLDCTLNSLMIPALSGFIPNFGAKKQSGGLSTSEVNNNVLMPFNRQRPYVVNEAATTTEIQADSRFVFTIPNITLALGSAAFAGCICTIINGAAGNVTVTFEQGSMTLAPGDKAELVWNSSAWISTQSAVSTPAANRIAKYDAAMRLKSGTAPQAETDVARKLELDSKAPTSHASTAATYGIGSDANYGHVKLNTSTVPLVNGTAAAGASGKAADASHVHPKPAYSASEVGAAPASHASTATTYGIGSDANYGHVKLNTSTTPAALGAAAVGASGKAADAAHVHALPSAAGVGAAPTAHASTATTYGIGSDANYGHVKLNTSTVPLVNGTAAIGASGKAADAAHVHPTDTSRAALASPVFSGDPKIGSDRIAVVASATTSAEVNVPIGSYVHGESSGVNIPTIASVINDTVKVSTYTGYIILSTNKYIYTCSATSTGALSGIWRSCGGSSNSRLWRRVPA
jgi:hypothetical protein